MQPIPPWLSVTARVLLTILIPIFITLTNVRLLLTPTFPEIEYNLPGFPDDPYGFTKADRLKWARIAIDYLLNNESIAFLSTLRFPEGQTAPEESCQYYLDRDCNRLYNDRELRHMRDVKLVTHNVLNLWVGSGILCLLVIGVLYYFQEKAALRAGLLSGAGLTVLLLLGIITYLALDFNTFFVQFHHVFFEGDSWLFLYTDTLIRLFPVRFWQDTFLFLGAGTILEAMVLGFWAWYGLR
jgi:integral membrane protein (TIGR01906 family)